MAKDKTIIISEIQKAFKNVELENGIGLSEANAIDDYKDERFRKECRERDEKHHWNTIPSTLLNQYNNGLHFFDDKGMRFHIPAFMIAVLKDEYSFDLTFALTNLSDYSTSQFKLLSPKQREIVKLFLEYLLEDPDYEFEKLAIKTAIENYWSK